MIMPFRSKAQRRWMFSQKPEMAERWAKETPSEAALPEHASKKGKLKKAEMGASLSAGFPNAAGPEDWDAVGVSPWKQGEPKDNKDKVVQKDKTSDFDDSAFGGDGTRLMPALRAIHKMGHVIPREKTAQGFEYADLGPNTDRGVHVSWQMPGKVKRSAGLDQEENLDDAQRGTDPPAPFPQPPDQRLKVMARERGPIKKLAQATYRAFLSELQLLDDTSEDIRRGENR
jgi:hypothetical protein